jgi:hypothetical protein
MAAAGIPLLSAIAAMEARVRGGCQDFRNHISEEVISSLRREA